MNGLIKIIKEEIILKALNEYNSEDSFLSSYDTAFKFAYENIDDVAEAFDKYDENPDNVQAEYSRDKYIELIDLYVDKYNELKNKNFVTIYRLIMLDNLKDLNLQEIGSHWSFEENGVGDYGGSHPQQGTFKNPKPFILEGIVNPNDINWTYGFHSFIWYGEDQWECALLKDAKVTIIKINGQKLSKPLIGIVGNY